MPKAPHEQNLAHIAGVSEDGLMVSLDNRLHFVSWTMVSSITGGVSKRDDNLVFVAIGIDGEDGERLLLVAQNDPIWANLAELLHVGLPIAPLKAWTTGITAFPGAYTLYRRPTNPETQ